MSAKKPGRPRTVNGNYQPWKERKKTCKSCGEKKLITEFPYKAGGTYQKGDHCLSCREPEPQGDIVGKAVMNRGKLRKYDKALKPARQREQDLDALARYALNNEGQMVDFEE